jgi:hypothetical protein
MPIGIMSGPKRVFGQPNLAGNPPYVAWRCSMGFVPIPGLVWTLLNDPAWVWAYPGITARTPITLIITNIDPAAGNFLYVAQTNLFAVPYGIELQDMFAGALPCQTLTMEDMVAPVYVQSAVAGGTLANIVIMVRDPAYYL